MSASRTRAHRPATRPVNRNNDLAAIHIQAAKCRLILPARDGFPKNDDDYRQLVRTISNNRTDSAKHLDHTERAKLLAHLSRLERALGLGGVLPQWWKLRSLWRELAAAKAIDDSSESAMNAWCRRQLGEHAKTSARWCDNAELEKLIEAAKRWLKRTT